jgi:ubiquinone/menaquinone biosynthesis C-methylase UbiE
MFSNPADILRQCGISVGSVVGDFGTGSGVYAHEAAKFVGTNGVVYAFDVQKHLIARLIKDIEHLKNKVIHPLWIDLEHEKGTGLNDDVLDLAICANVLFQIEKKESFIKEVARVIRPGGRVLVVDWKESFGHLGPHPESVVPAREAQQLLNIAGLEFDKTIAAGAHHYGFLFRKRRTARTEQ